MAGETIGTAGGQIGDEALTDMLGYIEDNADVWLGFKESALHGFLKKAGFTKVDVTTVAREATEPHFETLLASGVRGGR